MDLSWRTSRYLVSSYFGPVHLCWTRAAPCYKPHQIWAAIISSHVMLRLTRAEASKTTSSDILTHGCNQAIGSLLSAAGTQQAAAQSWWQKHHSAYFYTHVLLIKSQWGALSDSRGFGLFPSGSLMGSMSEKRRKNRDVVLFVSGKFILFHQQWGKEPTTLLRL